MSEDNRIIEIRAVLVDFGQLGEPGRQNQTTALEALERIDAILDSALVFFPGELIPGGMVTQNEHGTITSCPMSLQSSTIEVRLKSAAHRLSSKEWQAAVDRARDARADAEWGHTDGITP